MTTPEGKIKTKLDRMLKQEGVWKMPPQAGPYGSAGYPDRILCVRGLFVGVEAKADSTKKLTPLQELCRDSIIAASGKYFVVYDTLTIEAVREFIRDCNSRKEASDPKDRASARGNSSYLNSEDDPYPNWGSLSSTPRPRRNENPT